MSLLLLSLAGCLKPPAPIVAPEPLPVTVAVVVESYDDAGVAPASKVVLDPVTDAVKRHGLVPQAASEAALADFGRLRSSEARVDALGDGAVLLVELAPRYSSQMSGRYRWTVDTAIHLRAPGSDGAARTMEVPVHLIYAHEREEAAAEAAIPLVAREVSAVLEEWIEAPARP